MAKKSKSKQTNSSLWLFDEMKPKEPLPPPPMESYAASSVDQPKAAIVCPKCGMTAQKSVRPNEMGGTYYCVICKNEAGDDCFYFTPGRQNERR